MRKNPEVTVIITNYNYGKYVESAIDSLFDQDYKGELNLVVVNDGSTDDSISRLIPKLFFDCRNQDFSKKTSNIKQDWYTGEVTVYQDRGAILNQVMLIDIKNSGASVARNVGINYAFRRFRNTKIIAILDADDYYYPNKVDILANKLVEHDELGIAYSDYDIIKEYGGKDYVKTEFKEPYSMFRLQQNCIISSGALIKADLLQKIAPDGIYYDPKLHGPASEGFIGCTEDYDLWIRLSKRSIACHVPKSLSAAREHGNNQSHKMTSEIFNSNVQVIASK